MKKNSNLNSQVCKLEFVDVRNVVSINFGTAKSKRKVILHNGISWEEIYGTNSKFVFNETELLQDGGYVYEQKINMFFPGDDENELLRTKFLCIVRLTYSNNNVKIIGNLESPCIFSIVSRKPEGSNLEFVCFATESAFSFEN